MNEHESIRAKLLQAAAGLLDSEETRQVEHHVHGCEACRQELNNWSFYTERLRQLPQPSAPAGLVERTQARILREYAPSAPHQRNDLMLSALALLGWITSLAAWVVLSALTGGVLNLAGVNLLDALTWFAISTVLAWVTAGAAAAILRSHGMSRRVS